MKNVFFIFDYYGYVVIVVAHNGILCTRVDHWNIQFMQLVCKHAILCARQFEPKRYLPCRCKISMMLVYSKYIFQVLEKDRMLGYIPSTGSSIQ